MAIFATYQGSNSGSNQGSFAFVCSRNSVTNGHTRKDISVTAEGGGLTRYEVALVQLTKLQDENPGEIAVGAFANRAEFCPSGIPINQNGMTDMAAALKMMLMADNTDIRLVLISDGEPNDETETLKLASKFKSKIDTIFVGDETGQGREFLRKLAAATGGVAVVNKTEDLGLLSENITRLIAA